MLKQNGTINAQYPFRLMGGGSASAYRTMWGRADRINQLVGEGITDSRAAVPNGHLAPSAWILPHVAGGMSTINEVTGSGSIAADILAVKLAEANLIGSGDLTAIGGLIVQLLADLSGSGAISDAQVQAFLLMAASIGGSGQVSNAQLTGLGALVAALLGDGTAAASILTGRGNMAADLTVTGTGLSTANVGQAVWSAIAAANNTAGTMGEKLNDAGGSANPWTEVIESGYTAAEIMRLLASVAAGSATGLNGPNATFKSLDGNTDRVKSSVNSTGTRTITELDPS